MLSFFFHFCFFSSIMTKKSTPFFKRAPFFISKKELALLIQPQNQTKTPKNVPMLNSHPPTIQNKNKNKNKIFRRGDFYSNETNRILVVKRHINSLRASIKSSSSEASPSTLLWGCAPTSNTQVPPPTNTKTQKRSVFFERKKKKMQKEKKKCRKIRQFFFF